MILPQPKPTGTKTRRTKTDDAAAHPEKGLCNSAAQGWAKNQGWFKGCGKTHPQFMEEHGWRRTGTGQGAHWFKVETD